MLKSKRFFAIIIIAIILLFNICTTSYAYTIEVDVNGTKIQVDYTAPSLDENDIAEIEKEVKIYVENKEKTEHDELKQETLKEVEKKIEELIKEKEAEKVRAAEKAKLKEMEKEYRAEKNKIPNAGDTTILVLKVITVVSLIALFVIIVCSKTMKKQ